MVVGLLLLYCCYKDEVSHINDMVDRMELRVYDIDLHIDVSGRKKGVNYYGRMLVEELYFQIQFENWDLALLFCFLYR